MHELGIAQTAFQQTLDHATAAGATRVARIVLRVGQLSGVDADALRFALNTLISGTLANGAAVDIETVAAIARCPACGLEFNPGPDLLFICPRCEAPSTNLTAGRELDLVRLEFE